MSALLSTECLEGQVLQARDFRLEKAQVHQRRAAVVLPLDVAHAGALDAEDRQPLPVHAPHLDAGEFAAAREPEGAEEEVFRLEHPASLLPAGAPVSPTRRPPPGVAHDLDSMRRVRLRWDGSRWARLSSDRRAGVGRSARTSPTSVRLLA